MSIISFKELVKRRLLKRIKVHQYQHHKIITNPFCESVSSVFYPCAFIICTWLRRWKKYKLKGGVWFVEYILMIISSRRKIYPLPRGCMHLGVLWSNRSTCYRQMFEATIVLLVLLDILYLSIKGGGNWFLITYHSLTKESECIQESCGE